MTDATGREVNDMPQLKHARFAGILYLAFIVLFAFSTLIQNKSIMGNDAAATARNIAASPLMFRIGYMGEIVATLLFLWTAWALYVLLRPVGKNLALLFVLFNLAGVAVESVCTLVRLGTLTLLGGPGYLNAFKPDQLQALLMLSLHLSGSGGLITTLFYGAWLFPLAYLVFQSGFLPRILGVLLFLDGLSMMICFIQIGFFPAYKKWTYPLFPVMFIAEFGLALWLIVKGVKEQKEES
jgi:hypothetical protein